MILAFDTAFISEAKSELHNIQEKKKIKEKIRQSILVKEKSHSAVEVLFEIQASLY